MRKKQIMDNTITIENKQVFTPKQIADSGLLSLSVQWQARKDGKLPFFKVANSKILYSQKHLDDYFARCEQAGQPNSEENTGGNKEI